MMRKPALYTILILIYLLASCTPPAASDEEVQMMKEQLAQQEEFIEDLAKEKTKVNDIINQVLQDKNDLMTEEQVTKMEAEEKMDELVSVIERGEKRIKALERELKNQESGAIRDLVNPDLDNMRMQFANLKAEINRMKAVIAEKDYEIINLKDENDKLVGMVQERDNEISTLQTDKSQLANEVEELVKQKAQLTEEQERAKEDLANNYFAMGLEWKEASQSVSGFTNGKRKRDYVRKAISYFEKASLMGNPQADQEINILKSDKKYKDD